jgi:tetratricopeptide (TPR) repeat protein
MRTFRSLLALVLLVSAATPLAAQHDPLLRRIQLLESRGQMDSALALLSKAATQKLITDTTHLHILRNVSGALANSRYYYEQEDIELAIDALTGLDLAREPVLRRVVEQRRTQLERNPARQALGRGMGEVGVAVARVQHGSVDLALSALERIAYDSIGQYPLAVRDSAMRGLRWARLQRARQDSGFVATFRRDVQRATNSLSALLIYTAGLGGLAGLLYLLWVVFGTRKGIGLELEDLVEKPGDGRVDASRTLVKDVSRILRTAAHATRTTLGERAEDLDGVANLRAENPVQDALNRMVQSGALQVGTVSIDPKQFISVFAALAQRPYCTTLRGHLSPAGVDRQVLFVERFDRQFSGLQFRRVRSPRFYSRAGDTDDPRTSAIQAFVTDYLFDFSQEKPTSVLESFQYYCAAIRLLEDPSPTGARERLEKTKRLLERSVCADPHNWDARFKLAELLRKQGRYAAAADHLQFLLTEIRQSPYEQPPLLRAYLNQKPELHYIVCYNLALTHALGFSTESHDRALDLLESILRALRPRPSSKPAEESGRGPGADDQKNDGNVALKVGNKVGWQSFRLPISQILPARVTGAERVRIGFLALSAKASTLAAKMEGISERKGPTCMGELEPLREEINAILNELESPRTEDATDPRASYTALGVVLNAAGRAAHLTGHLDVAIDYLERAINRLPDMPDPHVNLAAALIRKASGARVPKRANEAIERALQINEDNGKAYYYLGRLALCRRDYKAANEHFARADEHHWSLYLHAQVLARHLEPPNVELALAKLEQSIERYRRPDERYVFFLSLCEEELKKRSALDQGTIRLAKRVIQELEESSDPALKAEGTHFRLSFRSSEQLSPMA